MTTTRRRSDPPRSRANSTYPSSTPTYSAPRPFRRRQVFPWWIWAGAPLFVVGVVFAMLQVQ